MELMGLKKSDFFQKIKNLIFSAWPRYCLSNTLMVNSWFCFPLNTGFPSRDFIMGQGLGREIHTCLFLIKSYSLPHKQRGTGRGQPHGWTERLSLHWFLTYHWTQAFERPDDPASCLSDSPSTGFLFINHSRAFRQRYNVLFIHKWMFRNSVLWLLSHGLIVNYALAIQELKWKVIYYLKEQLWEKKKRSAFYCQCQNEDGIFTSIWRI